MISSDTKTPTTTGSRKRNARKAIETNVPTW